MSHFTVMVFGANPEKLLQPFHEYECTGVEDEYVVFQQEATDEDLEVILKDYNETDFGKKHPYTTIEDYAKDYEGWEKKDGWWGRYTNPNAKWDWYQLGGRWSGYFTPKVKSPNAVMGEKSWTNREQSITGADQLLKGEIDMEKMNEEELENALASYEKMKKATAGVELPKLNWEGARKLNEGNIDRAREVYNNQPWIKAMKKANLDRFMDCNVDYYCVLNGGKDAFVKSKLNSIITPYACITPDGVWHAIGEMGWWGMSNDDKSQDDWNEYFMKVFNSMKDDTIVSLFDCHI